MNIHDVTDVEIPTDECWLAKMFERQKELMDKYHHIERDSGLLQTEQEPPLDHHCKFAQARFKDFSWRVTEELAEAMEAKDDEVHMVEEIIDGLHFLLELTILVGVTHEELVVEEVVNGPSSRLQNLLDYHDQADSIEGQCWRVVYELGLAANCLKNKPWKQAHMMTDSNKFKAQIIKAWSEFGALLRTAKLSAEEVFVFYFKKSEVNKFRQRSKY